MKAERILEAIGQIDDGLILEAVPDGQKSMGFSRRLHSLHRAAAAVILAALLMGAGAVAVRYGDSIQNWFEHYWRAITGQTMSEGQTALIDHLSQSVGISQTADGVTVALDSATVGDDSFFLLLRVEGIRFSGRNSVNFLRTDMEMSPDPLETSGGIGSFGIQYLGLDSDGAALLLLDYEYTSADGYVQDTTPLMVSLTLENLARNAHTDREKLLAEGQWHFEFSIDRSNPPEKIRLHDAEVLLTDYDRRQEVSVLFSEIELTNTGLRFRYDYADGTLSLGAHIEAVLKNGVTVGCAGGSGAVMEDETTLSCSYQWLVPIELDEVEAILIGETRLPVP